MSPKYRFIPIGGGGGGDTPTGTINITNNGTFDVAQYASASVNVPASAVDSGTLTIQPITSNVTLFTQDVTGYRAIAFQVAVPASAVVSGTKSIVSNGTQIDVTDYQFVDVNVQPNLTTETITVNGTYSPATYDGYSSVTVAVPASAVDSGTKQITTNGNNQDVVGYAAVDVNVPTTSVLTMTQAQYDALSPNYDPNTIYLIS